MEYGKITGGLSPLRRPKLSKKHKRKMMKLKIYMKLIGGGIIGYSNYIGTRSNGLIQEVTSKGKNFFQFI